jgi:hypothetical protein
VVTKKASGTRCTGDARGHGAKHGKAARMLQLREPYAWLRQLKVACNGRKVNMDE